MDDFYAIKKFKLLLVIIWQVLKEINCILNDCIFVFLTSHCIFQSDRNEKIEKNRKKTRETLNKKIISETEI